MLFWHSWLIGSSRHEKLGWKIVRPRKGSKLGDSGHQQILVHLSSAKQTRNTWDKISASKKQQSENLTIFKVVKYRSVSIALKSWSYLESPYPGILFWSKAKGNTIIHETWRGHANVEERNQRLQRICLFPLQHEGNVCKN